MYKVSWNSEGVTSQVWLISYGMTLLQAHYCMRYYNLQVVLHCLTDLKTRHYFKISQNKRTSILTIEWWHRIDGEDPITEQQLAEHTKFVVREVSELCSHS